MDKIITFGEIMLRLTPPEYQTIAEAHNFLANYGGGEANVAVCLSHLGHHTCFVSKLPNNQLGTSAVECLRKHNVCTDNIVYGEDLMGIYFLETGFGGRPSKVVYNRKNSAINSLKIEELNLEEIFKDATWFHVSGISLALSENVRKIVLSLTRYAHEHNITVSFDFNFRNKLWTKEEAKPIYLELLPYVDVLFSSYYDATEILNFPKGTSEDKEDNRRKIFRQLIKEFDLKYIFTTDRIIHTANENTLSAYCIDSEKEYNSRSIRFNIYDRIGGGDAFASGVIHGLIKNFNDPSYALEFGLATSVLKHTLYGDVCTLGVEDIENFIKNNGKSRVQR